MWGSVPPGLRAREDGPALAVRLLGERQVHLF